MTNSPASLAEQFDGAQSEGLTGGLAGGLAGELAGGLEKQPQIAAVPAAQADSREQALAYQKTMIGIANRIRRSLDFSEICETAVQEMRRLLKADRVAIYRFNTDWSGRFVFESVGPQWVSLLEAQEHSELISKNVSDCSARLLDTSKADTHLQVTYGGSFVQGEIFRVCADVQNAGFSDCYKEVLGSYQARAYAIIAIYLDRQLWGLLAAYQNSGPRQWLEDEVQQLVQVAEQIGIALKQAEYVRTIQAQSIELRQTLEKLQQSQAHLVQSEKMASLGQLVAGIAHEINNPVNFISANLTYVEDYMTDLLALAQLARQQASAASAALQKQADKIDVDFILHDLPKTLTSMQKGTDRIRDIVLSLRNFSRLNETGTKLTDLHEGIESTLLVLSHQLAANDGHPQIAVIKNYGDLLPVECDPAQINQAILSLITNAIYALKEACRSGLFAADRPRSPQLWISTQMSERNQAEIRIRDNGVGIEAANQSKVFDHFFTTKPVGEGTGLGLAIARQIVEDNHGGTLSLAANQAQGAEFIIRLPVTLPR